MLTLRLGYPYNVDERSILHKYDIGDPESAINAKRMLANSQQEKDDDIDYGMKLRNTLNSMYFDR